MERWQRWGGGRARGLAAAALACLALAATPPLTTAEQGAGQRTFASPEEAVRALADAVKAGNMDDLLVIFGSEGQELISSSDPATGRRNREVFTVAVGEGWRLVDQGTNRKALVIGNEGWPFPVPLIKTANRWRFDTAAGREEVLARRIGRNELAVIGLCRTYVVAQRRYSQDAHDGKPAGRFATTFQSDPGKQNGLYWPATRGQKRSPFGDLVAQAAAEGRAVGADHQQPSPFHGYYFRILTAQGAAAAGGAKSYVVDGEMSAGFALIAWPSQYDATGIMTFVINQEGVVRQKDLGRTTDAVARAVTLYNPDASWTEVQ